MVSVACGDWPAFTHARPRLAAALIVAWLGLAACDGGATAPGAPPALVDARQIDDAIVAADKALGDGRLDDALTVASFAAEHDVTARGHEMLGRVWLARATRAERGGDPEAMASARRSAADAYRTASDREPSNAALQDAAGMVLDMAGDIDAAAERYDRAVAADAKNVAARLHRANSLLRRSKWGEARAESDRLIELAPGEPWAHAIRGEALIALGVMGDAERSIAEARRLAPDETAFRVVYARLLRGAGRAAEAVELLGALGPEERGSIGVATELAEGWNALGKPEKALEAWTLAYRSAPPHQRLDAAIAAGRAALAATRRIDAKSWHDIAALIAPEDPRVQALAAALAAPSP